MGKSNVAVLKTVIIKYIGYFGYFFQNDFHVS